MSPRPYKTRASFFYDGDEVYEIEIGDEVEFEGDGSFGPATHLGDITAIYPKLRTARISYLDATDWNKRGEMKRKLARVPLASLTLIRRVM